MAIKSCMRCAEFMSCSNDNKAYDFSCHKYEERQAGRIKITDVTGLIPRSALSSYDPNMAVQALKILRDTADEGELDSAGYDTDEELSSKVVLEEPTNSQDYETKIRNILLTEMSVPIDVTVDDSPIPKFPNFMSFCMNSSGLDISPFPMQIRMATLLYAEYCPDCTDMPWFMQEMPVNAPYPEMERRIAFLHHGICPRCNGKKSDFIRSKKVKMYTELAAAIGQRGGKSALGAMIACYHTHWLLKLQRPNMVYNLLPAQVLQGTFVAISFEQAIDNLWDPYSNYLSNSPWFKAYHCLAAGASVSLGNGTAKPIEDVKIGDVVSTFEGTSVVTATACTGTKECLEVTLENGLVLPPTPDHRVRCVSTDGLSLVWKEAGDLTLDDFVVVE